MKVKLIQMTENPITVMYVAARTCYCEKSPIDIITDCDNISKDKQWNLVKTVLNSGHESIAEHVNFTFAIEGISRSCSHQLVRHRHATFSQQSQRYVEIKESVDELLDLRDKHLKTTEDEIHLMEICKKYFVGIDAINYKAYLETLIDYLYNIKVNKWKPEDARAILPNATKTNLVMTLNYRQLMHVCNLRLCTRAQLEIRNLFKQIKEEVKNKDEELAALLIPNCEKDGFCREFKSCGRKPTIKEMKK